MIFDKILRKRRSAFWVCMGLAMVFVLSAVTVNSSHAKGRFIREEWKIPDFYPRGFDGYGRIDTISKEGVTIADTFWKFSRQVQFATPRDRNAGLRSFSEGDTAAFLLNEKDEVISLWYIEFHKR